MPSLKQASQKANSKYNANKPNAAAVSAAGVSKLSVDTGDLLSSMETSIGDFIARVINNIDAAVGKTGDPILNTGNITNISAEQTDSGWQIKAPIYLDFQSKGVSGTERVIPNTPYKFSGSKKAVNLDAVKLWVQQRGIRFEGVSEDSTVFLIARSIYKQGIDPKNLWEKEVQQLQEEVGEQIANQIAQSFSGTRKKDVKIQ